MVVNQTKTGGITMNTIGIQTLQFYINMKTGLIDSASNWGIRGRNRNKVCEEKNLQYVGSLQCNQNRYWSENTEGGYVIYRTLYGKNVQCQTMLNHVTKKQLSDAKKYYSNGTAIELVLDSGDILRAGYSNGKYFCQIEDKYFGYPEKSNLIPRTMFDENYIAN